VPEMQSLRLVVVEMASSKLTLSIVVELCLDICYQQFVLKRLLIMKI